MGNLSHQEQGNLRNHVNLNVLRSYLEKKYPLKLNRGWAFLKRAQKIGREKIVNIEAENIENEYSVYS